MMTKPNPVSDSITAALARRRSATAAQLAEILSLGQSTVTKHLAALESAGAATRTPGGRQGGRRVADSWSAQAKKRPAPKKTRAGADAQRLGRGELAGLVLDQLRTRPAESFGPAAIAKALERSAGAVSNALGRLVERGDATLMSAAPRRYQLAATAKPSTRRRGRAS